MAPAVERRSGSAAVVVRPRALQPVAARARERVDGAVEAELREALGFARARAEAGAPKQALGLRLAEMDHGRRAASSVLYRHGAGPNPLCQVRVNQFMPQNRGDCSQRELRLLVSEGSRVVTAAAPGPEAGKPRSPRGRGLDDLPELHRQRQREQRSRRRACRAPREAARGGRTAPRRARPERRSSSRSEGRSARAAPPRPRSRRVAALRPRRSRGARRRAGRASARGTSTRASTTAVPTPSGQRGRLRQEDQRERCEQQGGQQQALASPRDARAAEKRRERGEEADQPAQRAAPAGRRVAAAASRLRGGCRRARRRPSGARSRSPRPRRRAMPPSRGSSAVESARARTPRTRCPVHLARIALTRPPGKCRAAQWFVGWVLPAAAREEPEQQEHQHDDQDDPENRHEEPFRSVVVGDQTADGAERLRPAHSMRKRVAAGLCGTDARPVPPAPVAT